MKFDEKKLEKELDKLKQAGWLEDFDINNIKDIEFTSPNENDVFNALKLFKPEETQILIIGQDPYPEPEKAHGYAFSVLQQYTDEHGIDDSLLNIFKAIKVYQYKEKGKIKTFNEIDKNEINFDTNLKSWARTNGVLLLNTALTYERTNLHNNIEKNQKYKKMKLKMLKIGFIQNTKIYGNLYLMKL